MTNFLLSAEDIKVWNNYISTLSFQKEDITPKYTLNDTLSRKLDLHGYPIHTAWQLFKEFIEQHNEIKSKTVIIITGRSGQMALEFKEWCKLNKFVKKYEAINPKNGIAGSYRVTLKS